MNYYAPYLSHTPTPFLTLMHLSKSASNATNWIAFISLAQWNRHCNNTLMAHPDLQRLFLLALEEQTLMLVSLLFWRYEMGGWWFNVCRETVAFQQNRPRLARFHACSTYHRLELQEYMGFSAWTQDTLLLTVWWRVACAWLSGWHDGTLILLV